MYFLISSSHVRWGNWNGKMSRIPRSLSYSSAEYNCITVWFGVAGDVLVLIFSHSLKQLLWLHLPNLWYLSISWGSCYLLTQQTPWLLCSIILRYLLYVQGGIAAVVIETRCSERVKNCLWVLMCAVRERRVQSLEDKVQDGKASRFFVRFHG